MTHWDKLLSSPHRVLALLSGACLPRSSRLPPLLRELISVGPSLILPHAERACPPSSPWAKHPPTQGVSLNAYYASIIIIQSPPTNMGWVSVREDRIHKYFVTRFMSPMGLRRGTLMPVAHPISCAVREFFNRFTVIIILVSLSLVHIILFHLLHQCRNLSVRDHRYQITK